MQIESEGRMQAEEAESAMPSGETTEDTINPEEAESAMSSGESTESTINPEDTESMMLSEETTEDTINPEEAEDVMPSDETTDGTINPNEAGGAMGREEMEAAIEAILFATGRAVSSEDLARALEVDEAEADALAASLSERWNSEKHGTDIIRIEKGWQMCTRKEYYPQLIILELTPKKPRLTDVLLETLSVVAYKQPVTKAEIERIRGVNSDHAVNKLVEYHLVKELGRAKLPGRPILFGTTEDFLRVFGVSSKENLPVISQAKVAGFREEAEAEAGVAGETAQNVENTPENEEEESEFLIDREGLDESTTVDI